MSGSWAAGWAVNDIVTAAEFKKGAGCVADSTLAAAATSIDFPSLPTTYAHMLVLLHGRGDTAAVSVGVRMRLNNDSSAIYYSQGVSAHGTLMAASESLAATSMSVGDLPAATASAGLGGSCAIWIPGYATVAGALAKGVHSSNSAPTGTTTGTVFVEEWACTWASGAIVNRVTLLAAAGNFVIGTHASVYVFGA